MKATRRARIERNLTIAKLYTEGVTQDALAQQFKLTKASVGQILAQLGIKKTDRLTAPSQRTVFTGVHLAQSVKRALRHEAKREAISMSAFISAAIIAELTRRNVTI